MLCASFFANEVHMKWMRIAAEVHVQNFCSSVLQTIVKVVFSNLKPQFQMEIMNKDFL